MRNVPMCAVCAMSAGPRFLAPGRIVLLTHSMQGEDVGRPEGDEREREATPTSGYSLPIGYRYSNQLPTTTYQLYLLSQICTTASYGKNCLPGQEDLGSMVYLIYRLGPGKVLKFVVLRHRLPWSVMPLCHAL